MQTITKTVKFDPAGAKLWLRVDNMIGLVRMDYIWQLLSANPAEHYLLSKTSLLGSNKSNRCYQIVNDYYTPPPSDEAISKMDNRFVDLEMTITGTPGDTYSFSIDIVQGIDNSSTNVIGTLLCPAGASLAPETYQITYKCTIDLTTT